jgi:hypothetical protein
LSFDGPERPGRDVLAPVDRHRLLWAWLSRFWAGWQDVLVFVQPRTVIA